MPEQETTLMFNYFQGEQHLLETVLQPQHTVALYYGVCTSLTPTPYKKKKCHREYSLFIQINICCLND